MARPFLEEGVFLATGSRERVAAGAQACDEGETATVARPRSRVPSTSNPSARRRRSCEPL